MPDNPCPWQMRASQPERVQKPMGLPLYVKIGPPVHGDRTLGIQELDPRYTETGPPRNKATRPGIRQTRTQDFVGFKTSRKLGLRGIQDFVGPRISWDLRLRGTQDFMGSRTLQKIGTLCTTGQDLVLWRSLREHKLSR